MPYMFQIYRPTVKFSLQFTFYYLPCRHTEKLHGMWWVVAFLFSMFRSNYWVHVWKDGHNSEPNMILQRSHATFIAVDHPLYCLHADVLEFRLHHTFFFVNDYITRISGPRGWKLASLICSSMAAWGCTGLTISANFTKIRRNSTDSIPTKFQNRWFYCSQIQNI
jgi:hypothetical protein